MYICILNIAFFQSRFGDFRQPFIILGDCQQSSRKTPSRLKGFGKRNVFDQEIRIFVFGLLFFFHL